MKRYLEQQALLNVLQGYTIFIIFFLLVRVFFFFYFGGAQYFDTHSLDIFRAFILGLRYDLIVTSYLLAPVVIFLLLIFIFPLKWLYWLETLLVKISVLLGGVLFLAVEICDLSFYSFFQDHINILFYGLFEDDTSAVLESIWKDYPVVWIGLGIIVYQL
jgi:magnesium-transporting ATPase (P-type)